MSQHETEINGTVNRDDYTFATNLQTKIHRATKSLEFMNECQNMKLLPNFTKLSRSFITQGHLSPKQIIQIRQRKLSEAIQHEHERLHKNEQKLNKLFSNLQNIFNSHKNFEKFKFKLRFEISKREHNNDKIRTQKFNNLKGKTVQNFAKINIQNISECDIPNEVLKSLELGLQIPVGGKQNELEATKDFKSQFEKFHKKFDSNTMEVISWDAKSLFTNVCSKTVVNYIISEIYKDQNNFFKESVINEKTKRVNKLKVPKLILKNFFMDILTKFSSFSSLAGFYRQVNGISMGSKLSPGLATIFCYLMEKKVIKNHQKNGNILFYRRYVDDIIAVCKINTKNFILREMNKFSIDLEFTEQIMINNEISILDTSLYIDSQNILQIKQYKKPIASDVLNNYKKSIMPKSQKIGSLMGEIYRANNTTSTENDLNNALLKLKETFIKNEYPEHMINSKIELIKNRNFRPNMSKIEKEHEVREHSHRSFNLCHHRFQKVAANITNIIKYTTPEFKLNICWKNIKLSKEH